MKGFDGFSVDGHPMTSGNDHCDGHQSHRVGSVLSCLCTCQLKMRPDLCGLQVACFAACGERARSEGILLSSHPGTTHVCVCIYIIFINTFVFTFHASKYIFVNIVLGYVPTHVVGPPHEVPPWKSRISESEPFPWPNKEIGRRGSAAIALCGSCC